MANIDSVRIELDANGKRRLAIIVDSLPTDDQFRYEERGGMFYAENDDGWVRYLFQDDTDKNGFHGRCFDLPMLDGTTVRLEGPWSSNPGSLAEHGFPWVVEVTVYLAGSDSRYHSAITAAKAHELELMIDAERN